jgi:hypothetical protein
MEVVMTKHIYLILLIWIAVPTLSQAQLSGLYTIGSGGDYENFTSAANALKSEGVSGPVTFDVLSGTYMEQFSLGMIAGVSSTNTVLFQSQAANYKSVTLQPDPISEIYNYAIKLEGTQYVSFQHLTFEVGKNGRAFDIGYGSANIQIDSCHFMGVYNTNSGTAYALIFSADEALANISITGNRFDDCAYGIYLAGEIDDYISGIQITGNDFNTVGYTAIFMTRVAAPEISGNSIESFIYGIYAPTISGATTILKNRINAGSHGITTTIGGTVDSRGLIANNLILVNGGSEMQGLDIRNSAYLDVYHNSVAIYPTNGNSRAFNSEYGGTSGTVNILNNSFASMTTGYAYYIGSAGCINQSDYNNYYSPGNMLARWDANAYDLADLKQINGQDAHSLSVYPSHLADDDLHSNSLWLSGKGTPLALVVEDIDGDTRSASHPDIGADEYSLIGLAPMFGDYTVGAGQDYETIGEAVAALRWRGVSDNVFLRLNDPVFDEQVEIISIPGSGPDKQITFTTPMFMPPGDSVVVQYATDNVDRNWVIRLLGADFIEIRNLHLQATGTTYSSVIQLDGGCDSLTLLNNTLRAPALSSNDARRTLINSPDGNYVQRRIEGNTMTGGTYGINMRRATAYVAFPSGAEVRNNDMRDIGYTGIQLLYHDAPQISGNTIIAGSYGITLSQCTGAYRIEKNKLDISGQYGMRLVADDASQLAPGMVTNNFVHVGGTGNAYGIYASSSDYMNVLYNSVHITSKDVTDGRAFYCASGSNVWLRNNIFANTGGGYAYYVSTTSPISSSDYNDFYSSGTNLAQWNGNRTDLAALQTASGSHANCISVNPEFTTYNDLHTEAAALAGTGIPVIMVSDDIDGDLRHLTTPDMGADEFSGGGGEIMFSELDINLPGIRYGEAIWGDYDYDGDLDIFMSGNFLTTVYENEGSNVFSEADVNLLNVNNADISFTDNNFDNQIDLFLTGTSPTELKSAVLYENDLGTFTSVDSEMEGLWNAQSEWADFDNDGDYDLLVTGQTASNLGFTRIYIYQDVHFFDWDGYYNDKIVGEDVQDGSVAVTDYDRDGDFDFVLSGILGSERITRLYRNTNGTFEQTGDQFTGVNGGALAWGDYDSDGDPDLLISGYDGISGYVTKLYENDENEFIDTNLPFVGFTNSDVEWADYDSDGDLDLLICGLTDTERRTTIYSSNGGASFTPVDVDLPGLDQGSVAWGDCDGDGDLDILLCGDADGTPVTKVFINNGENAGSVPQGPNNLKAQVADKYALLTWDPGSDGETATQSLTYNLRIYSENILFGTKEILSPLSHDDGNRLVVGKGNMHGNLGYKITGLSPGTTYHWSVQAIDQSYRASSFIDGGSFSTLDQIYSNIQNIRGYVGEGELDFGDYDNDGDLDFIICGMAQEGRITEIYTNNNGSFIKLPIELPGVDQSDVEWGDYNNDGLLDFVLCGRTIYTSASFSEHYVSATYIFRNDGGNAFTQIHDQIDCDIRKGVATWGDCDNDGDLDLLISGCVGTNNPRTEIYLNQGNDTFQSLDIELQGFKYVDGAWGDCDNDGDLDFVLHGEASYSTNNMDENRLTNLYINESDNTFTLQQLQYDAEKDGTVAWGDYDNDGDLDLVTTGRYNNSTRVYKNFGNRQFELIPIDIQQFYDSSVQWGDFDVDGDADLLITGNCDGTKTTAIYTNEGIDYFRKLSTELPPVQNGTARWADWSGDGTLDLIVFGEGFEHVRTYQNNIQVNNTPPVPPEDLRIYSDSDQFILQWNRAVDMETPQSGLYYNVKIGNISGRDNIKSAMSDADGYRKIVNIGNVGQMTSWPVKLKSLVGDDQNSDLYWSVQTIDNGYMGSAFSKEDTLDLSGRIDQVMDVPHDQGGKVTIRWKASDLDYDMDMLTQYSIWRALPTGQTPDALLSNPAETSGDTPLPVLRKTSANGEEIYWEWVADQPAHKLPVYGYTCSTVNDSMSSNPGAHYFMISAHTSDANVFFDSEPIMGYSVDNLAPAAPKNLIAKTIASQVNLHWNPNTENDFAKYQVFRSMQEGINPEETEPLASLTDTVFTDPNPPGGDVYYVVCAKDVHDNLSPASNEVLVQMTGIAFDGSVIPEVYALRQNYPNPFNPMTTIAFDLPENTHVRLDIYNMLGEKVIRLVDQELAAGRYQYLWQAQAMASGTYYYSIQTRDFRSVKRMVFIK